MPARLLLRCLRRLKGKSGRKFLSLYIFFMSGHSKWHSIKHKKAATDKKRGKIFTRHAKLIQVAARNGGDADMNPTLRTAIDNAKAANMPVDNIERAIRKGSGELKEGMRIEEVMYEGFGPGGTAFYIQCLTDNRNRTIASLKVIMSKNGGSMGAVGSVGYLFKRVGMMVVGLEEDSAQAAEKIELVAIDKGAQDVEHVGEEVHIFTDWQQLMAVRGALLESGLKIISAELIYVPATIVPIRDKDTAGEIEALIELLEEDDDVSTVFVNAEVEL